MELAHPFIDHLNFQWNLPYKLNRILDSFNRGFINDFDIFLITKLFISSATHKGHIILLLSNKKFFKPLSHYLGF